MIAYETLLVADRGQPACPLRIIDTDAFAPWRDALPPAHRALITANRFTGKAGEIVILPDDGELGWSAAIGAPTSPDMWWLAAACARLPAGTYRIEGREADGLALLGWLLAQYRFAAYKTSSDAVSTRVLVTSAVAAIDEAVRLARATALVRDLVNTPAEDLGPAALQREIEAIGSAHYCPVTTTSGDSLAQGYPMIAAVGRAADRAKAPRLIELTWGDPANPAIAIIGKGITFDSGGLNIKPSSGMRTMKKDMGGAAHAIALARLVIEARLPVRLHLLVAAAENAIAGNAFRPGDILTSRKGLTVEIDNTDAEGRLVLADAITRATEETPVLLIDFATLTGAARIALGPDLPAMFANDDALASEMLAAASAAHDPVWRMPLWRGYEEMLASEVADCVNSPDSGFGGAITAALFLEKFVPTTLPWVHFDTYAWRNTARPGRPKGGDALGLRAAYAMLAARFSPAA